MSRHYIILMQDNRFIPDTFFSKHFIGQSEGNVYPPVPFKKNEPHTKALEQLRMANFEEVEPLTFDEVAANQVVAITYAFYDAIGLYKHAITYNAFPY